ncbi:MAG TPA: MalY/PatB family protein [Clostridia bacterium]|nr:MalY/PatB family protein [Clostridia bacterium]
MAHDFDRIIPRRNTDSLKFDYAKKRGRPEDILPLWVADMDFSAPPEVLSALRERVEHGIFGYSDAADSGYFDALNSWYQTRFDYLFQESRLTKTPGVVYALSAAIRAFTREGDGVLIQPPVYYPFTESVVENNRTLAQNVLVEKDGHYEIDLADFERQIVEHNVKLFLLCSPHNPVGRVWTRDELLAMGDICLRHDVIVVSDEIHADFVYPGNRHTVFASLKTEFEAVTVTCTAPSKTFNLAGLQIANIFITNDRLRKKFRVEVNASGYSQPNAMGLIASRAAYTHGAAWLDELLVYLRGNLDFLRDFLARELPRIRLIEPEGTYLAWLDCRGLRLSDAALNRWITNEARLWLDAGTMFGPGGEGFQRINYACPRATLEQALLQLKTAFDSGLPTES